MQIPHGKYLRKCPVGNKLALMAVLISVRANAGVKVDVGEY